MIKEGNKIIKKTGNDDIFKFEKEGYKENIQELTDKHFQKLKAEIPRFNLEENLVTLNRQLVIKIEEEHYFTEE